MTRRHWNEGRFDRGTPVDRRFIEAFIRARRRAIVLLATAPSVGRVSSTYPDSDFWRFTPAGIVELFTRQWPDHFSVHAFGSLRTCVAFLLGEAQEDLPDAVLLQASTEVTPS
jgi:hypothetical protein